ncbi:MAG: type IV secretion protein IcmG [Legionella sp.]|nr:MAG: type IV secretion protein IcmG [Legionella sp.]
MVDNDQNNDEYQFTEMDSLENDSLGDSDPGLQNPGYEGLNPPKKDIRKNALIVVGVVIFAVILYKIIGSWYFGKAQPVDQALKPTTTISPQPIQTVTPKPVVMEPQPQVVTQVDPDLKQKVSAIEISQQGVKSQVSSLSDNVNTVNNNISSLNTQVTKMNQLIEDLTAQLAKQSDEINQLRVRAKPKAVYRGPRRAHVAAVMYYVQAVIPGRAWLIGTNGSTLTVREGTRIPGYGVVKLIDSIQGQVLTSSGRVIRYSQEDS